MLVLLLRARKIITRCLLGASGGLILTAALPFPIAEWFENRLVRLRDPRAYWPLRTGVACALSAALIATDGIPLILACLVGLVAALQNGSNNIEDELLTDDDPPDAEHSNKIAAEKPTEEANQLVGQATSRDLLEWIGQEGCMRDEVCWQESRGKSGVYGIACQGWGVYVGSSVDIGRRWREHIALLNRGRHHSKSLQEAWSATEQPLLMFRFMMLETVQGEELLKQQEQLWLDTAQSQCVALNSSPFADRPRPLTPEEWKVIKDNRLTFGLEPVIDKETFEHRITRTPVRRPRFVEELFGSKVRVDDLRTPFQVLWDRSFHVLAVETDAGEPILFLIEVSGESPWSRPHYIVGTTDYELKPNLRFLEYEQVRRWLRRNDRVEILDFEATLPDWLLRDSRQVLLSRRIATERSRSRW